MKKGQQQQQKNHHHHHQMPRHRSSSQHHQRQQHRHRKGFNHHQNCAIIRIDNMPYPLTSKDVFALIYNRFTYSVVRIINDDDTSTASADVKVGQEQANGLLAFLDGRMFDKRRLSAKFVIDSSRSVSPIDDNNDEFVVTRNDDDSMSVVVTEASAQISNFPPKTLQGEIEKYVYEQLHCRILACKPNGNSNADMIVMVRCIQEDYALPSSKLFINNEGHMRYLQINTTVQ